MLPALQKIFLLIAPVIKILNSWALHLLNLVSFIVFWLLNVLLRIKFYEILALIKILMQNDTKLEPVF